MVSAFSADSEPAFCAASYVMPATEREEYLVRLRRIKLDRRICDQCLMKQALGKIPPSYTTEPEEARLRLAVETGRRYADSARHDVVSLVLDWARGCQKQRALLQGVVAGWLLPVVDARSGEVTFRETRELPARVKDLYRKRLSGCGEVDVTACSVDEHPHEHG